MAKRKRLATRIVLVTIAVILAGVMTFGGVCLYLINQDNISDKYTLTEEDDSFLVTLLKNALTGSEFELTEAQINTYLFKSLCSENKFLRRVRVYFHKDGPSEIYARIFNMDREQALSAKAQIELIPERGVTAVRVSDVKLGELHVHKPVIDSLLRDFAKSSLLVDYYDDVLYIKTEYTYEGKNFSLSLRLERFDPDDGFVHCKTNSLTREVISAVKDYLLSEEGREQIKGYIGDKLSDLKDKIKDKLADFFS